MADMDDASSACAACGGPVKYVCRVCGSAFYCGAICQLSDWNAHRIVCSERATVETYHDTGPSDRPESPSTKNENRVAVENRVAGLALRAVASYAWPEGYVTVDSIRPVPTGAVTAPGDDRHLYVMFQSGQVLRFDVERERFVDPFEEPWLDVSRLIAADDLKPLGPGAPFADERGLLSLAFHPLYAESGSSFEGKLFLLYSTGLRAGKDRSARWLRGTERKPHDHRSVLAVADRNRIETVRELRTWLEPQFNHNGAHLLFDPNDRFALFVGVGDGGGFNDQHGRLLDADDPDGFLGNAQDLGELHGKVLRFVTSSSKKQLEILLPVSLVDLTVPDDNPFVDVVGARPEIWAYGFRNPWRMAFDESGRLYAADVGQNAREALKPVKRGGNHGWRATEGSRVFNETVLARATKPIVRPVFEYVNVHAAPKTGEGMAIIGGHFYRGSSLNSTAVPLGAYVFGDYGDLKTPSKPTLIDAGVFVAVEREDGTFDHRRLFDLPPYANVHALSEGPRGGCYVFATTVHAERNAIYKLETLPAILSKESTSTSFVAVNRGDVSSRLTDEDVRGIFERGKAAANVTTDPLRRTLENDETTVRMHFSVAFLPERAGEEPRIATESTAGAWHGSYWISRDKAWTALAFSSDENALSTRSIGVLSQPGAPLWQIGQSRQPSVGLISFPGGVPLYKNDRLVGAVGVSGSTVDQDEAVAVAASRGFEAPAHLRSDSVADVPYVKKI